MLVVAFECVMHSSSLYNYEKESWVLDAKLWNQHDRVADRANHTNAPTTCALFLSGGNRNAPYMCRRSNDFTSACCRSILLSSDIYRCC